MKRGIFAAVGLVLTAACTAHQPVKVAELGYASPERISLCHGYGCAYRSKLDLGSSDGRRFREIMSGGAASPEAERAALSRAEQYFDRRSAAAIGVRDKPKTQIGQFGIKGQMDCVDEATNTHTLLVYLQKRGLLKHHRVLRNESRGYFLDARYPHFTAVISDPAGVSWAVDPWYGEPGDAPDIMPMTRWKQNGNMGG